MLSEKIKSELNQQINREFSSCYKYLAAAAYCDSNDMSGFAHWFKLQAQEEIQHGMKIYNYLDDMGGDVELLPIEKPKAKFANFEEVFQSAVDCEKALAQNFNDLASLAQAENDQITHSFLKWFLDEQIEEIALTSSILAKIKLIGNETGSLYLLDQELGKRTLIED